MGFSLGSYHLRYRFQGNSGSSLEAIALSKVLTDEASLKLAYIA